MVFYTTLFRVINTEIMLAYSCFIVILLFLFNFTTCGIIWINKNEVDVLTGILFQIRKSLALNLPTT